MNDDKIFQLAQAAGLLREWTNASGKPMQVSAEALRAILEALGFPCTTNAQCEESKRRLAELQSDETLLPLVTGTVDQPIPLPALRRFAGSTYRIVFESSAVREGRLDNVGDKPELPAIEHAGYHRLIIGEHEITLAIAPPRCFGVADALRTIRKGDDQSQSRLWGLGVQLYSLPRAGDGGIGDFTSLAQFATAAAGHGAAAVAISPVHAMFSADVHRFSPYGPSSRIFLNALHIDPESVLGKEALATAIAALGGNTRERLQQFEQQPLIDWPEAASLRLALLRRLFEQFEAQGDQSDFEAFRQAQGEALQDHARFEALHGWRLANGENGDWRTWPEGLRSPRGHEVEAFALAHAREVRFHEFLQWQAARGLSAAQHAARQAGMPIGLITDLAVGADNGGSQAWSRQGEIINGLSVGAPPDIMNPHGQSWGIGAFSPQAMKAKGFGAYLEMLRATFTYAGGARIDHVLGLSRLWLVPHGASPQDGAYLQYPLQDLLRLIALESWRHRAIVIGEDLGTVPEGFDTTLARTGLLGIRVLLFQQDNGRFLHPSAWPPDTMATTTTHDLPTIAGWWQGRDIDWRVQLDLLKKEESEADARQAREQERAALWQAMTEAGYAHGPMPDAKGEHAPLDAATKWIADAPAPLAMLPAEDALGLVEQPNLPGTVDSHPNWRRRLPQGVDSMLNDKTVAARLAIMNKKRSYQGGK